jgi:hypothetical protein
MLENFHAGGERSLVSGAETLAVLRRLVTPGMRTIETGSGASTVSFAELGADHTAISPSGDEHDRIKATCAERGIDVRTVRFFDESSDVVLPRLADERFALALIDGEHAFPFPIVDFHYLDRMLDLGGWLIVDDAPINAVGMLGRFLDSSPDWQRDGVADDRALIYRKVGHAEPAGNWRDQPMNHPYPSFWFLPPARRAALTARAGASWVKGRF